MQLTLDIPANSPGLAPIDLYLKSHLITYIGNKRTLLPLIGAAFSEVRRKTSKPSLHMLDMFSGTGVVARLMKTQSSSVWSNDLEEYSSIVNRCFLSNPSSFDYQKLAEYRDLIDEAAKVREVKDGFIRRMYAPENPDSIRPNDRVFYTVENAEIIDSCVPLIRGLPQPYRDLLMGPFLSACSKHVNTSGVFKGFYKNKDGIGQFGGTMKNALQRILKRIEIDTPILIEAPCDVITTSLPAETLVENMERVDVAYFDPPYNQHPYGSNYFMLNAIARYEEPLEVSRVSGIPNNWNRSAFNKPQSALQAMSHCVSRVNAQHVIISYNSEGFITVDQMQELLERYGDLQVMSIDYPTFRGCRNLKNRDKSVKEYVFLLDKG